MKAKARKAAKCLGKVSVKVQELMKNYPPVFENKIKRDFFKSALFYHRKQHGIVKISRWTYDTDQSELYDLQKLYLDIQNSPVFFLTKKETTMKKYGGLILQMNIFLDIMAQIYLHKMRFKHLNIHY